MKRTSLHTLLLTLSLLASLAVMPACSVVAPGNSPSSQVLSDIRSAETALLTAETIINIRAKDSGKPVSPEVKAVEALLSSYLEAARTAANAGDTVTVDQKLDLFNTALAKFNTDFLGE